MTLDSLLGQYSEMKAKINESRDSVRSFEEQLEKLKKSIADQISEDFGKYVATVNSNLPEDQRVTEWHVNYDGGMKKAFITITGLGGKLYNSDEFTNRLPLPRHLGDVRRFGQNYPVDISFDMLNHQYLDIPLAEMK